MRELENNKPDLDSISQVEAQQRAEIKMLASQKLEPGQSVFKLDMSTGIIWPAEYKDTPQNIHYTVAMTGQPGTVRKRVNVEPGFMYCVALNIKNAHKKFIKRINENNRRNRA